MKTILTAEICNANDFYTIQNHSTTEPELIHKAALAVLDTLQTDGYDLRKPLIMCGGGNNGADGMDLACMLKQTGADVSVLYLGKLYEQPAPTKKKPKKGTPPAPEIDPALIGTPETWEMSEHYHSLYQKVLAANIPVLTELPALQQTETAEEASADQQQVVPAEQPGFTVIVDAVYGTGMRDTIKNARACDAFDKINQCDIPVVAIDIPSGVLCDTGAADAHALYAHQTVTMQQEKVGIMLYPGAEYAGKITVADIGIQNDPEQNSAYTAIECEDLEKLLPARPARSNKGTFGRVLVVGGAPGMAGAAYFAAAAAYRAGAGLVEIVTHVKNRTILQQLLPEAVLTCYADKSKLKKALKISIERADAIVLGCGSGKGKLATISTKYVLKKARKPLVVDADALNIIAGKPSLLKGVSKKRKPEVLITPHPAEAARLLGKKYKADTVLTNLPLYAERLCNKYKVNVLLKDARTLTCSYDKQTKYINLTGSTALSCAGAGDILAGLVGGLCAAETNQNSMATTAALAAFLHGKAGEAAEQAVGARTAMARDILDGLTK